MNNRTVLANAGVFLTGLTLFMYEITLTRLFSTLLWYHFVFIVISLAMLGGTIGSVLSFRWLASKKESASTESTSQAITARKVLVQTLLSFSLWGGILFLYQIPYSSSLLPVYVILSTLPFIFGGYYLSLAFKDGAKISNTLYFADLLGSAMGSVFIVLLLDHYSLIRIGIILGLIPLLITAFNLTGTKKNRTASIAVSLLLILTFTSGSFLDNWAQDFGAYKGNPKLLGNLAKNNARIVYTLWNSLARTDVVEVDSDKSKYVLMDGGSVSEMIPFNGDLNDIEYLKDNVSYFPFGYKKNNSALLIGPGGGEDLLFAKLGGIDDITAVEINPGAIEAAKTFENFNGNIYGQEGTKVYVQDGRSFINRDENKYDLIYLSKVMTQSSETLGYALSENYIYTKEAYEAYFNHLSPEGTLAFVLHSANDLGKATATLLKVLEERGIPKDQAVKYIAVINSSTIDGENHNHGNQIMYPLLMVKNTPFTPEESQKIAALAKKSQQEIISLPHLYEKPDTIIPPENLATLFLVTDNYPFFYNEGHSAPILILSILLMVLLLGYFIIRPLFSAADQAIKHFRNYFAYLGLAFMLIEVPLIQKLILLFGHPTLTFSAIIAMLLFSAGLGSLFSKYLTRKFPLKLIGTAIFAYSALLYFALPWFISSFQGADIAVKILATLVLILPLGLLMGIPFPTGIRLAEMENKEHFIPAFWAVNGWMSVVSSILALVLAMSFGYNITLLAGAFTYLIFAFHTRNLSKA